MLPGCCGSRIEFGNMTAPAGSFLRIAAGPSFYLGTGIPLTADLAPPSRISDLQLVEVERSGAPEVGNLSVNLKWTSPGGDFDFGKGKDYIIVCYAEMKNLL